MEMSMGYRPGCIGRIAQLHAAYYSREVGFGVDFEAKVATELSAFCLRYQPANDGIWLAHQGGVIHGSVVIDGSRQEDAGAHLRWFITSDEVRGQGVGSMLLEAAMAFCRQRGHRKTYLWTFDRLPAARHLYEKQGFSLTRSQLGNQWGLEVNEQLFSRLEPGP